MALCKLPKQPKIANRPRKYFTSDALPSDHREMMKALTLVIALVFAATAFAQPTPVSPSPGDGAQIQQSRSSKPGPQSAEPRGTEKAPLVIQLHPAQVAEIAAANQKSIWEWILLLAGAVAAIAVAFFTGRLWVSTEKLWQASTQQAALLRESVDTNVAAASPYLFPRIVEATSLLNMPDAQKPIRPRFEYVFDNLGKSPAMVTEFTDAFRWFDALPQRPFYLEESITPTERGFAISAGGHSHNIPCRLVEQIGAWPPAAADSNRKFFFIGIVKYEDFFGYTHTSRFCLELIVRGAFLGWRRAGGNEYNRTHKEKRSDG